MSDDERQILVVNAGSGSLHIDLFAWQGDEPLAQHDVDWRGASHDEHDYAEAVQKALNAVDRSKVAAIGHRVVHGGDRYTAGVRVDEGAKQTIRDYAPLAPLHNPIALAAIEALERALPGVPQVACFDTAFHHTLPPRAYHYGLPFAWYELWGVRRFGFHGLSHAYCAGRAAALLGRRLEELKLVTCHLGSGCSLAAIEGGRSVATTMGYTPLEGVVMGARSGSIDPGLVLYLIESGKLDAAAVREALSRESGLKGLSGVSADMRKVLEAKEQGNERAALAFEVYTARVREAIGAMAASIGGLDAVVFADGVGEHMPQVRETIVAPLGWMGIALDPARNAALDDDARDDADISASGARARTLVIHTREALMVAREVRRLLDGGEAQT